MSAATALLLLNGELSKPALVKKLAKKASAILCTDGGARHAARLGLEPRIVIGDMDSLPKTLPRWKDTVYLCDFDEEASDFEKGLRFTVEHGFAEVWVAGLAGGRLDHTLVNAALLERYSSKLLLRLAGEPEGAILHQGEHRLACSKGKTFTFLAVGEAAHVTASGLKYPVQGLLLDRGSRGLSNVAVGKEVRVTVHSGAVWALY